ncbi:uncharacterized protein TM35_000081110 [Trypanosoma theileri]|uniref:Saposin B-type domain-containing protein n=1 Tax=Trypanosoma theileri TaxID=67003 RepID=A0A1X0P0S9_9TRYP|nr:uncharacterized protein TM35_000081110 [Trypanosoma theileri]ORC90313.1 hypothetical protein TM35_000081110 [Trypanosoma theileri]
MRSLMYFVLLISAATLLTLTNAKKEKPLNEPFPKDAIDAISCDICSLLVRKTYLDVQALFAASVETRVRVNEDDILTAIEDVCNPFAETGQWIRRVAINYSAMTAPFLLGIEELPVFTKCKRTCTTIVEACEAIMDHDSMDQLTPKLLHLPEYADGETLARSLCQTSPICTKRKSLSAERYAELRTMIKADVMEEIDPKEMEVERMMDQMERKENRRHDIFSREEITAMQQGLLRGDREAVAKIDPSIMDLNNEEFAALQAMIRGKMPASQEKVTGQQQGQSSDNMNSIGMDQDIYNGADYGNDEDSMIMDDDL